MAVEHVGGHFEALFRTYPGALVIVTPAGEVIAVNAAARGIAGEQLAPGVRIADLAHPADGAAIAQAFGSLAEDGTPLRFTCRSRAMEGEGKLVEWQVWRAPGEPLVFAALSQAGPSVTHSGGAAKTGEDPIGALVLRAVLDHLEMTAWATDKEGIYTFHDGKALAAAGLSPGQFIGKNVYDVFRGYITPTMQAALDGTAGYEAVSVVGVHWENHYVPIRDADGKPAGVIGISQNVNEGQRIRDELEARLAVIERQQAVIRDLETPIIEVWDHVLTLPMIGVVDSRRATRVMDDLLGAVVRSSARFAILDLTGVEVVDTATASYLVQMIRAIRLLGAEGILTGIRPTVAQTVISLGVDLSGIPTHGTLRHGLSFCIRRLEAAGRRTAS